MRRCIVLLSLALFALTACRGSQAYTSQDFAQVKQVWRNILPTYVAFKHAFLTNNKSEIIRLHALQERQCRPVTEVDNRDTIDPNVKLFEASVTLDDFCDAIESGYASWAKNHHYPYNHDIQTGRASDIFGDLHKAKKTMRKDLADPAGLA